MQSTTFDNILNYAFSYLKQSIKFLVKVKLNIKGKFIRVTRFPFFLNL